jgi:hypothetical protein
MLDAGTLAVNWLPFTKVVGRGEVFHATVEPGVCVVPLTITGATKFEPFTVSVNAPLFGDTLIGERLEIKGVPFCTLSIVKVAANDGPPGSGFDTVIAAIPELATSDARITTASCPVVLFRTLVRIEPFQKTCDGGFVMNPLPEINILNIWLPAVILDGNKPVITGVGGGCGFVLLVQLPSSTAPVMRGSNAVHRKRIS